VKKGHECVCSFLQAWAFRQISGQSFLGVTSACCGGRLLTLVADATVAVDVDFDVFEYLI